MPGTYSISVDEKQLKKLKMKAIDKSIPLVITKNTEGEFIDGLEITIKHEK